MKNRDLLLDRLDRIDGKVKTIDVMMGRPTTTARDLREMLEAITEEVNNVRSMIEREPVNYGK